MPRDSPLPASSYIDPAVFEVDKLKVFYRTWQCVGHVSELAKPGYFLTHPVVDEEILVVRGDDSELRAFFNVCRHRGHPVAEGRGWRQALVCRYHGWTYNLDGKFRAAPQASAEDLRRCESLRLRQVGLEVFCGFVFVNLDDAAPALAPTLEGLEEELRSFHPEPATLRFVCETGIEHECNWKVSVDNYNECYHCPNVHASSLVKGVLALDGYTIEMKGPAIWHLGKAQTTNEKQYDYDPLYGQRGGDYGSFFIWPNVSIACYPGGFVSLRQWLPVAHRKTIYLYRWFSDGQLPDSEVENVMRTHRETTGAEDAVVVAKVQRGMESQAFSPGPYVIGDGRGAMTEAGLAHLHELYRQFIAAP